MQFTYIILLRSATCWYPQESFFDNIFSTFHSFQFWISRWKKAFPCRRSSVCASAPLESSTTVLRVIYVPSLKHVTINSTFLCTFYMRNHETWWWSSEGAKKSEKLSRKIHCQDLNMINLTSSICENVKQMYVKVKERTLQFTSL